ncbi:ABC transporter substrate-binding protein [bacterium]|nr:ABC transporter substrate-binding protein [bacterium]
MVKTSVATATASDRRVLQFGALGLAIVVLAGFVNAARAEDQKIIVSHGISTFGDLKYGPDFTPAYVNVNAPKGGEISEWAFGSFDSMNPYSVKGSAAAGSSFPYESILTGTADEIGASYCLMCKTIEYPQDRSWVIFHLRDDVKFSDGSPMTADDVIFSYNIFATKGLSDFRTIFNAEIEKAEALDPLTVKFTFKPGIPTRDLPASVGGLPIISKADYEANKRDLEESSLKPFLGTGPYVLDRLVAGQTVVYKRNPKYWGENLPINKGQNNFDTVRYEYFADPNAAFEGFKGGTYTFRQENSSKSWATQYDFPLVQSGAIKKVELPNGQKANGQAFVFNLRRDKFKDPRVREAIGLMFNFEWSNKTLFYGLYARINSIWENSYLAASGPPSPDEVAVLKPLVDAGLEPASILTDPPIKAPVSGEGQLDRKNLRKASALLDAAGWKPGPNGRRVNDKGEVLSVSFLNDNSAFDRVITPFVENLKALGIDASLTDVDSAQFDQRTSPPSFDFDIITANARAGMEPGDDIKQFYSSSTANNSVYNVMGLASPAVDKLADVVAAAKSKDQMITDTRALDRVLLAERFWIPQWYKNTYTLAYYDIYGHPDPLPPYALGELSFWWYDADKAAKLKAAGVLH